MIFVMCSEMITTANQLTSITTIAIYLFIFGMRITMIYSEQLSNIRYSILNYSPYAVHYYIHMTYFSQMEVCTLWPPSLISSPFPPLPTSDNTNLFSICLRILFCFVLDSDLGNSIVLSGFSHLLLSACPLATGWVHMWVRSFICPSECT